MSPSSSLLLNPPTPPKLFPLFPTNLRPCLSFASPKSTIKFRTKLHYHSISLPSLQNDDVEDIVIGDCIVFEEGAFEDPYLQQDVIFETPTPAPNPKANKHKHKKPITEIEPENLIPDQWHQIQAEINITKKERRKIAQQLEFGSKVEKKKKGYEPIRNVNLKEYLELKQAKLAQVKPLVLDNPSRFPVKEEKGGEVNASSERVAPKNPRWAVYGRGLEDVTEFFNSGNYEPGENKASEGTNFSYAFCENKASKKKKSLWR
jgi:hypothetical protein